MGKDREAIREGKQAVALFPMKKDAYFAPGYSGNLAQIYARVHLPAEAVKLIRKLLSIPAGSVMSLPLLRIDPVWNPIRKSAEFQALLKSPAPTTGTST